MEASLALLAGIIYGFSYCWEEALICIAVTPLLVVSSVIKVKIIHGISEKQGDLSKEANLYCSDCICNFKTVQSFGHLDVMLE